MAAAELLHIATASKAGSKQSVQINNSRNQNRICKKIVYVYGRQDVHSAVTGTS